MFSCNNSCLQPLWHHKGQWYHWWISGRHCHRRPHTAYPPPGHMTPYCTISSWEHRSRMWWSEGADDSDEWPSQQGFSFTFWTLIHWHDWHMWPLTRLTGRNRHFVNTQTSTVKERHRVIAGVSQCCMFLLQLSLFLIFFLGWQKI